jgi:hypothetical protein
MLADVDEGIWKPFSNWRVVYVMSSDQSRTQMINLGGPEGVSESVTASPDQPLKTGWRGQGKVCCASHGTRDPLPSAWADFRCADLART